VVELVVISLLLAVWPVAYLVGAVWGSYPNSLPSSTAQKKLAAATESETALEYGSDCQNYTKD